MRTRRAGRCQGRLGTRRALGVSVVGAVAGLVALAGPLLGVAATAQAAGPEILRVAPGGSDPSCVTPCATISQAVTAAAGDLRDGAASAVTIVVAAGSYDEHVTISAGPS